MVITKEKDKKDNKEKLKIKSKKNKGITLIALIVTIIVLLVLSGITISMLTGQNGILTKTSQSKIMSELSRYKEEFNLYKVSKKIESSNFDEETLTAGKTNLYYNTKKSEESGNLKSIIPNISDKYFQEIEIIKGEMILNTKDKSLIKIAKSLGIKPNPYDIVDGELLSSNGNLLLMDDTGTLTLPDSITKIGEGAFANVEGLKIIIIPGSVKEIKRNAFAYNTTIENVVLENGIEIIGSGAFAFCSNLKNIELPESLNSINNSAFYCCVNLNKIVIPSNIEIIPRNVFCGCSNLNEVIFNGDKVKTIGAQAFEGCKFSIFTITSYVENIETNSFDRCYNLLNLKVESSNFFYESGILLNKQRNKILFISSKYYNNNDTKTLTIPEGIITLSTDFSSLNITTLNISSTVNKLYTRFFSSHIEKIDISPDNSNFKILEDCIYSKDGKNLIWCFSKSADIVLTNNECTDIEAWAFKGATNAINITLSESTKKLKEQLFTSKVRNVTLGRNVNDINSMFAYRMFNININLDGNDNYFIENNVLYTKNKETLVTVLKEINGTFSIDNEVKNIASSAFYDQSKMSKIVLNNNITKIDGATFWGCYSLETIDIPKNVTRISGNAFSDCKNLNEINLHCKENKISGAPWGAPKGMKVVYWNN